MENKKELVNQEKVDTAEKLSFDQLKQYGEMIKAQSAPTGALDVEFGHIDAYIAQAEQGRISVEEAYAKIDALIGGRNDYH